MKSSIYYDQEIIETTINKLKIILVPNNSFTTTNVNLAVNYGSENLDFIYKGKQYHSLEGTAHFIEHKLFEIENNEDALSKISELGASCNAYTSNDETAYMFSTSNNFYECFKIFLNFIFTNNFNDKGVNKEKGIILEELNMMLDIPTYFMSAKLLENMYQNIHINKSVLGTVDSINNMTKENLLDAYNAFYHPENMCLTISGKIDLEELSKFLELELNKYKFEDFTTKALYANEDLKVVKTNDICIINSEVDYVFAGIKINPYICDDFHKLIVIKDFFDHMLFSETTLKYNQLLEDNTFIHLGSSFYMNKNYMYFEIKAATTKQDELIDELEKMILNFSDNFDEEDFELFKRTSISNFIYELDNYESLCYNLSVFYNLKLNFFDYVELVQSVTKEDIINLAKNITKDNICFVKSVQNL